MLAGSARTFKFVVAVPLTFRRHTLAGADSTLPTTVVGGLPAGVGSQNVDDAGAGGIYA